MMVKGILAGKDSMDELRKNGFASITVAPDADLKEGETVMMTHGYDAIVCIINELYVDQVMHLSLEMSWEELPNW